ncbi:hypothetical protein [Botrimarina hoheduenensis]|uniref:Uncharacterized protein n=1 Tax=Botrimarina hoheduenensis TaxID=2528000 RepID=A0A5C5W0H2_9BACT|nr:hypothetical protein [Botrimarina hoheduenensis]TWT43471.1 hypothetical protein Pla111_24220 [Botrimarina hoheduenensis]
MLKKKVHAQETILPPIDLSRLRRGRGRRSGLLKDAGGGLSSQMLRALLICFLPWLLKAGVALVAVAALWFSLPNVAGLARLVGFGFSGPSQVTDLVEWSRVRLDGFANAGAYVLGDFIGREGGSAEITPLVGIAPEEATAR